MLATDVTDYRVGATPVTAVRQGATLVWPKLPVAAPFVATGVFTPTAHAWNPGDIPGLAAWIDPQQDLGGSSGYGSPERMLADTAPTTNGTGDYTIGTRFLVNVGGKITHIRAWVDGGTHTFSLWNDAGTKIANAVATVAGPPAWREVALSTPVDVVAGSYYTTSVTTNGGGFGYSTNPASLSGGLGSMAARYATGADVFPSSTSGESNYHVDVVYQSYVAPLVDGQPITAYRSHDPGGRAFVGGNSPVFRASSAGGKPRIQFSSALTSFMYSDNYNPGVDGMTFVMVTQTDVPSNYGMMLTWGQPATGMEMRQEAFSLKLQCIENYSVGGPVVSSAFTGSANTDYVNLLKLDRINNKFRLYINDTLQFDVGTVALPNIADRLRLGYRADGYYYNGLIAEAMVISGPISDSDRAKLMTYLRGKHGALPGVT